MTTTKQEENLYTPNCIRTYSGIYMNVFEPTLEMICIEDIAHALSNMPRFGGHTYAFYSVAQHSINCSYLIDDPKKKLAALMHDASETYLIDMPRPIKMNMPQYKEIENKLMELIAKKFEFEWPMCAEIKKADEDMLRTEWDHLMISHSSYKMTIKPNLETKNDFLRAFTHYNRLK